MNDYKNKLIINIYGAGLYGILLAFKISKLEIVKKNNIKIKLLEKSNAILSGWNCIEVNGKKFNNGFHGLEMPRSERTYRQLSSLLSKDIFKKKDNLKLISINGHTLNISSPIDNWPKNIKHGLLELLNKDNKLFSGGKELKSKNELKNYPLGKLILKCFERYSNNLEESWHLFYPWFYPKEFINNLDDDEGSKFRFQMINGDIKPYYIEPKNGLFQGLKKLVEKNILKNNIEIIKNIKLANNSILVNDKNNEEYNINIWASSAVHILNNYSKNNSKQLISSSRNLLIAIFSIENKSLQKWQSNYPNNPSEILCLSEDIPSLSRISFPDSKDKFNSHKKFISLEIYSKNDFLSKEEISKCINFLSNLFKEKIFYEGFKIGRKIFNINPKTICNLEKEIIAISKKINIFIPYLYWGPINMAKCGIEAEKSTLEIEKYLLNSLG